ncbi:hypothetical protein [Streptomyces sp. GQFP]|uniref:hypothetical protein n=1 Tax=Streptomyces sp. GQFP TaxID=2907545 RepID=UPI001F32598A|nr:hypothetical protein [Streptomyces sp. GQFP]UIX31970.1 hypothetical protein LUX31_19075 [Streptomyces sp. GQFP]
MSTRAPARAATPADDDLHPPATDDPFWTETAWFAFAVPERRLTGFVYPVFRANQRICSSGVYLWDDTGETDLDCLYAHNYWHIPLPDSLTSMRLPSGLSYDVLEPLRSYRVRYDSHDLRVDLTYDGLVEPVLTPRADHLDQPCRVQGEIVLLGERIEVDGFEFRDKSWSVRSDHSLVLPDDVAHGSYMYGVTAETAFLARTTGADPDRDQVRRGGWLLRDGVTSPLVEGTRRAEREPGRPPTRVVVEGRDELGRTFTATGDTVNHFAFRSTPAMSPWVSGVQWTIDGVPAWGENQEWSLTGRARRARPPASPSRSPDA